MSKVKALLYCTKMLNKGAYLVNFFGYRFVKMEESEKTNFEILNGKIVCECEVETEEIQAIKSWNSTEDYDYDFETPTMNYDELLKRSCLDNQQMENYLEFKGYALHLSNIKVFDKPREVSDYHISYYNKMLEMMREKHLEKAPQNMCRVFDVNGPYILISVRPQWLCLILNKQKDIEVRRKVLKGMCD